MSASDGAFSSLVNNHDLSLPNWGPWASDFYTLSHIADQARGLRMDFMMVPGICHRSFLAPETLIECGCSAWRTTPDLSFYSFRQQLEGRDEFYSETSYSAMGDNLRLGRIEFVNRTDSVQSASLLLYARFASLDIVAPVLPPGARWLDAVQYRSLRFAEARSDHNLVWGGARRGEQLYPGTVGNSCIGQPFSDRTRSGFGAKAGDCVDYDYRAFNGEGRILMRMRLASGTALPVKISVDGAAAKVQRLVGSGEFELIEIYAGALRERGEFSIISEGGADENGVQIDGFVLLPAGGDAQAVAFKPVSHACAPAAVKGELPQSAVIRGNGLGCDYTIWWSADNFSEREYRVDDLRALLRYSKTLVQPYYTRIGSAQGRDYCKETYILPIVVPPGGSEVIYALYGAGEAGAQALAACDRSASALEAAYQRAAARAIDFAASGPGAEYAFSQRLLSANLIANTNFPIRVKGGNIRHNVPAKQFNSLYSWDSGFIGLGLTELDERRAVELLNAYCTEPEDDECAFILYGTPLPVQAYLYAELWNRFQNREMLAFFYPRLKHYYDFIAGHIPTSTTRKFKTNLLQTWDYFYNSGGWDDYPPQWQIYLDKRYDVAPVVTTAHAIRFAKFLAAAARELGIDDAAYYAQDIADFTAALQRYAWDPAAGIFSYTVHDDEGNFAEFYRDPVSQVNFNFGLDGETPLVAGVCTPEQEQQLWQRLESAEHQWTPYGLSTVDRSAPYYRTDGYWNGCVWMPHQWFFWKSALDAGRAGFARQIALTALEVWRRETDRSYCTFEHFLLVNGRGAGCHNFSGLSSPVLNWYGAYFQPGRLTGGFDLWIADQKPLDKGGICAELRLGGRAGGKTTVLYVSGEGKFRAEYAGQTVVQNTGGVPGVLELELPCDTAGTLRITRE